MSIQVISETQDTPGFLKLFILHEEFMDDFVDSLANPGQPKHCIRFYLTSLHMFQLEPQAYAELRCARPDVFAAVLRFLTLQRSDSDIRALEEQLSTCHCAQTLSEETLDQVHFHQVPATGHVFESFVERAAAFLMRAISNIDHIQDHWLSLDHARKEAKKADKRGEQFPWPKQSRDIFVNPPDVMLQMLWKFYHTFKEPSIVVLFELLLVAAGTTFTSVIYTIPDFPLQFTEQFERVLCEEDGSERSGLAFTMMLQILLCATNRFYEGDANLLSRWRPHARETILVVTKALQKLLARPSPKFSDNEPTQTQLLIRCGHILLFFCGDVREVVANIHRYHPLIIVKILDDTVSREEDHHITAYDKIYRLAKSDRCHAPGCQETFSKQDRTFQACSGCMVVSYCSKKCQALAWKHRVVPHKPFCAALVSYTKKIDVNWRKTAPRPQDDPVGITRRCLEGGVTRDESTRLLNFDLELLNWNELTKSEGEIDEDEFRRHAEMNRHK